MISLAGGCLPGQMLHSAAVISHGYLCCRENAGLVQALMPPGFQMPDGAMRPAEEYVGSVQSYKHDGRKPHADLLSDNARTLEQTTGKANPMMPYGGECVLRGAAFAHRIILNDVSEIELGAMVDSLARWQHAGGAIGGQRARGNGALKISIHVGPDADLEAARAAYLAHVDTVREEAVAFLDTAFDWTPPVDSEGEAKGKRGRKAKDKGGDKDADANPLIAGA